MNPVDWDNQLIQNESSLTVIAFWLGLLSVLVTSVAAVSASISTYESRKLLKRLIIFPFRDQDKEMSLLPGTLREDLLLLFLYSKGKRKLSSSVAGARVVSCGKVITNVAPSPSALSADSVPWPCVTMSRVSDRPRRLLHERHALRLLHLAGHEPHQVHPRRLVHRIPRHGVAARRQRLVQEHRYSPA